MDFFRISDDSYRASFARFNLIRDVTKKCFFTIAAQWGGVPKIVENRDEAREAGANLGPGWAQYGR